jgi:hypothetical protein
MHGSRDPRRQAEQQTSPGHGPSSSWSANGDVKISGRLDHARRRQHRHQGERAATATINAPVVACNITGVPAEGSIN